jgi:hypothetical protein
VVVSDGKYPNLIVAHTEEIGSANLVLGAMLGAYLGLTISREGLPAGSAFDLGGTLILCCLTVMSLNAIGDRVARKSYFVASAYTFAAILGVIGTLKTSAQLKVDQTVLVTIFVVWGVVVAFSVLTAIPALRSGGNRKG